MACSKKRLADCKPPCQWIKNKGCRSEGYKPKEAPKETPKETPKEASKVEARKATSPKAQIGSVKTALQMDPSAWRWRARWC